VTSQGDPVWRPPVRLPLSGSPGRHATGGVVPRGHGRTPSRQRPRGTPQSAVQSPGRRCPDGWWSTSRTRWIGSFVRKLSGFRNLRPIHPFWHAFPCPRPGFGGVSATLRFLNAVGRGSGRRGVCKLRFPSSRQGTSRILQTPCTH